MVRRERLRPLVDDLQLWPIAQRAKLSPRSKLARAIAYSLKCWDALTRFLDDGRICLSNNAADRALRGVAGPRQLDVRRLRSRRPTAPP